jgi:hypothetical protein
MMIRRPSIVHSRWQAVQPRSSPNRLETLPVRPIVPPQTQVSPGVALRAARRPNTREGIGAGCSSWLTNLTATSTLTATTTMMIVTR